MTGTVPHGRRRTASAHPDPGAPVEEPTGTTAGRTGSPAPPAGRTAALLAEASARAAATAGAEPPGADPAGPAHRWHVAARTRVPRSLLLLALTALAVLAWAVLGPGPDGVPTPGGDTGGVDAHPGTSSGENGSLAEAELPGPAPAPATSRTAPAGTAPPGAAPGGPLLVHVTGEVARPGVVELAVGDRVVDAVEAAGGLTGDAVTEGVNLAAPVADGQQVLIPAAGSAPPPGSPGPGPRVPGAPTPAAPAPGSAPGAGTGLLDLNTATAADLEALPRVGPVLAERIVAFRDQHGGFASVADLDAVEGVGPALMEALAPLVTV